MQEKQEMIKIPHKSVLVEEVIQNLNLKPHGIYLDVTFGAGGHSRILLKTNQTIQVIGFDMDQVSLEEYGSALSSEFPERFQYIWANFANLYKVLKKMKIDAVDGILADLGTSQMQLHERDGFSFMHDTPLDMRMSPAHYPITAAMMVNTFDKKNLADILFHYGQEAQALKIVNAIIKARSIQKINTTLALAKIIEKAIGFKKPYTTHPATRTFQALRIAVNHELDNLERFLQSGFAALKPSGRLVCISFHSLEDRIVKDFFLAKERSGNATIITKRIIGASVDELHNNPSARSAKLRTLERVF
jgi:16S rRNA (cytosine1402-N4)-methyltransferase